MTKLYHVFIYNEYDGMDSYGDRTEEQLKGMLNLTGYDRINIDDLVVIEGKEISVEELNKIKER